MDDHSKFDGGGGGGVSFDDDVSDSTVVDDFTPQVAGHLGRGLCKVAINLGRFGDSIGGIGQVIDSDGDPGEYAAALSSIHAHGNNVARCLLDAHEQVVAGNEIIGKAAARARDRARELAHRSKKKETP